MGLLVACLLLLGLPARAQPPAVRVQVTRSQITVACPQPLDCRSRTYRDRLVLEVFPATFIPGFLWLPPGARLTQVTSDRVRIELPVSRPAACHVLRTPGGLTLKVDPPLPAGRASGLTVDAADQELIPLLKLLARAMKRNLVLMPGVEGKFEAHLYRVPAQAVLDVVLSVPDPPLDSKKLAGKALVVGPPEKLATISDRVVEDQDLSTCFQHRANLHRQEVLLENAPVSEVLNELRDAFPGVAFTLHPTMNGFYCEGHRDDILAIKAAAARLDRPQLLRQVFLLRHLDPARAQRELGGLVSACRLDPDRCGLICEGTAEALERFRVRLAKADQPLP